MEMAVPIVLHYRENQNPSHKMCVIIFRLEKRNVFYSDPLTC